ncbi:hypothetical protein BC938DRAFT_474070 [Jimgerdemannia flammicorona]|uniref:Uncharacterized protein n=1 Tax=Jimgerdemannia flammicorona TaxID=994334 RepID=A0A433QZK4_9FUNG|nr:hypothetical protein BC938DRAFT_474070 [Jimgerdemannia flammicorona]
MAATESNANHLDNSKKRRREIAMATPPPTPAKIPDDDPSALDLKRPKTTTDPEIRSSSNNTYPAGDLAAGATSSLDEHGILEHLTSLLDEIVSIPYSSTIPARLLTDLRLAMVGIEALCADGRNVQARQIKAAADNALARWLEDLVTRCGEEERAERERNGLPPLEGESGEGEEELVDVEGLDDEENEVMVTVVA